MLNSDFSLSAARELAALIARHSPDATEQIELLYERTLGRPPTERELADAAAFLISSSQQPTGILADPPAALVELCLAMFNLNEFIYVD